MGFPDRNDSRWGRTFRSFLSRGGAKGYNPLPQKGARMTMGAENLRKAYVTPTLQPVGSVADLIQAAASTGNPEGVASP